MNVELVVFGYVLFTTAILLAVAPRVVRALRKYSVKQFEVADRDAPSVSVLIPARNEMHAMTECLNRVIASDYRKMEVIVYDDHSEDQTSHILKSFARGGVRFISGDGSEGGWIGRNYALDRLIDSATGTYVLVLDVDTYIQPTTISQLVGHIMATQADMISVLPGRSSEWRGSVLLGTLRYYWDIILAGRKTPVVGSVCWMARRTVLVDELGAMESVQKDMLPERALANRLGVGRYRCTLNTATLGVTFEKKLHSQYGSAVRTLYPMFGGRWHTSVLMTVIFAAVALLPLMVVIAWLEMPGSLVTWLASLALVGYMTMYGVYCLRIWHRWGWAGGLMWPVVALQELVLICQSQLAYWRGVVLWKGRNILAHSDHSKTPTA